MRRYPFLTVAAALVLPLASQDARATPIEITAGASGALLSEVPSATVLTFDGLPVGRLPFYQFDGGTLSGSGYIENTSVEAKYAEPAGDRTNYLTISYPSAAGEVQLVFSNPENYFGLYWGSMDRYNSITFFENNTPIATFSGTAIAGLLGLAATGDQQSPSSNRYINFHLGDAFYDKVVLSTTDFGLEVDNIGFGDPPVSAPISEPGTIVLFGSSLFGLALLRRRRAA